MKRKKYNKIQISTITLTPAHAKELIKSTHPLQRKISIKNLKNLTRTILDGGWLLNGKTIVIDWHGCLQDGQHRCKAIIEANKSIKTIIVYGVDPDCFKTIDKGKPRNLGDTFRQNGELYYSRLACAINLLHQYKEKMYTYGQHTLTDIEACKFLEKHPKLRDSIAKNQNIESIMSSGIAGCFHYLFSQVDADLADQFFNQLTNGDNLNATNPVKILRDQLLQNKGNKQNKLRRPALINILIKCWNDYYKKRNIKNKKYQWRGCKKTENEPPVLIET